MTAQRWALPLVISEGQKLCGVGSDRPDCLQFAVGAEFRLREIQSLRQSLGK